MFPTIFQSGFELMVVSVLFMVRGGLVFLCNTPEVSLPNERIDASDVFEI